MKQTDKLKEGLRVLIRDSLYTYHGHYSAAKICHNWYIVLSVICGFFSAIVTMQLLTKYAYMQITIICAFIATISSILNASLQLDVRSTKHKSAGDEMLGLYKNIVATAILLNIRDTGIKEIISTMDGYRKTMNLINSKSPMIPRIAFRSAKKEIEQTPDLQNVGLNGSITKK